MHFPWTAAIEGFATLRHDSIRSKSAVLEKGAGKTLVAEPACPEVSSIPAEK